VGGHALSVEHDVGAFTFVVVGHGSIGERDCMCHSV
jgi:hypothetical protein